MASSFVKLKKDSIQIPGIRTSLGNSQVCSTGSNSFDFVIGGGIEMNSIFLIGEDKYGRYAEILTKLFLADGFHHKHQMYFASLDENPRKIMRDIPVAVENLKETQPENADSDLRIAFRYQDLPVIDSVQRGSKSATTYDLNKKYEREKIESHTKIKYFSYTDYQQLRNENSCAFDIILEQLDEIIKNNPNELLRICISSIGSPIWYSEDFVSKLLKFLAILKSIARYNNVICYITMPLHLINIIDNELIYRIRRLVDCNINLEAFDNVDKQTNAIFKQYHGLLHIKKLQTLTALQSHKPEAFDLAFKLKSHQFVIEKLHLPPELQDNDSSEISMSCSSKASGANKSLDF